MKAVGRVRGLRRGAAEATARYASDRAALLDDLLADPSSWRYIAVQATAVRREHDYGSPAWSTLTRLSAVARDLVTLAENPPNAAGGPQTTPPRP